MEQGRHDSHEAWPIITVVAIMQSRKIPGESSTVRKERGKEGDSETREGSGFFFEARWGKEIGP